MVVDRARREEQPLGDRGVAQALGEQPQHLELAGGQRGGVRPRRRAAGRAATATPRSRSGARDHRRGGPAPSSLQPSCALRAARPRRPPRQRQRGLVRAAERRPGARRLAASRRRAGSSTAPATRPAAVVDDPGSPAPVGESRRRSTRPALPLERQSSAARVASATPSGSPLSQATSAARTRPRSSALELPDVAIDHRAAPSSSGAASGIAPAGAHECEHERASKRGSGESRGSASMDRRLSPSPRSIGPGRARGRPGAASSGETPEVELELVAVREPLRRASAPPRRARRCSSAPRRGWHGARATARSSSRRRASSRPRSSVAEPAVRRGAPPRCRCRSSASTSGAVSPKRSASSMRPLPPGDRVRRRVLGDMPIRAMPA